MHDFTMMMMVCGYLAGKQYYIMHDARISMACCYRRIKTPKIIGWIIDVR